MSVIFITGASGFIGRHLAKSLARDGQQVLALIRMSAELGDLAESKVKVFRGDFALEKDLAKIFDEYPVEIVFHLASMVKEAGVPDSLFYQVNVEGTRTLLEVSQKHQIKRLVYVSTTGVLGDVDAVPAPADAPYKPVDIYQKTKTEAEKLVLEYGKKGFFEVVVGRPGAVYGPGDKRFLKIFKMINQGIFVMLGPGENYLHPVYVSDLAEGLKLCATVAGINGRIYNLAGRRFFKVKEWIAAISRALGKKTLPWRLPLGPVLWASDIFEWFGKKFHFEPPIFRRRIEFFVKNRAFNISSAVEDLGFKPEVELEEGLKKTVAWYRDNKWL